MKIDSQLSLAGRSPSTAANSPASATETRDKRSAPNSLPQSFTRGFPRRDTSFSQDFNQQYSTLQAADDYLGELSEELADLKLRLSKQLSATGRDDRPAINQSLTKVNALLAERSSRSAKTLDANFNLHTSEPARSRISIQGLESVARVQAAGQETLVISGGRPLTHPMVVALDEGMAQGQVLRRFNTGLAPASMRAEVDAQGALKFTLPEDSWQQLKSQLKVQGEGKLAPAAPGRQLLAAEEGLNGFNPQLVQESSFKGMRQLLDSVVGSLNKVSSVRDQVSEQQASLKAFIAEQANPEEQQWAANFVGSLFDGQDQRQTAGYNRVATTVAAQAQLTRYAVVSLLS